jgi:hypothetical protein
MDARKRSAWLLQREAREVVLLVAAMLLVGALTRVLLVQY